MTVEHARSVSSSRLPMLTTSSTEYPTRVVARYGLQLQMEELRTHFSGVSTSPGQRCSMDALGRVVAEGADATLGSRTSPRLRLIGYLVRRDHDQAA